MQPSAGLKLLTTAEAADYLRLKERKDQNIVVSGHTNTVPGLIRALGVERDVELVDADYDNLFVITVDGDGPPRFLHLHFGY